MAQHAKAKRINNRQASDYVKRRESFTNNNGTLYGLWRDNKYVVYSYGEHFPLFVWMGKGWYENSDSYSLTTARHKGYARPTNCTASLNTAALKALVEGEKS